MRGNTKDVTNNAFTLVFSIAVIFALYIFGTAIFQRGAAVKISAIEEGGCACLDAATNTEISCGGAKSICQVCKKDWAGRCEQRQKIGDLKKIINHAVKKIKVCKLGKGYSANVYVDGILKKEIPGDDECSIIEFSEPKEINEVEVYRFTDFLDRIWVSWER